MTDVSNIAGALGALKTMKDLVQSMIGLRDTQAFQAKAIELQSAVMDAQHDVFAANEERAALIKRVNDLERQMAQLENWEAEKKRYQLTSVAEGTVAYSLKPGMEESEPSHFLCANCFERRRKSYLQEIKIDVGRCKVMICSGCSFILYTQGQASAAHAQLLDKLKGNKNPK